MSDIIVGSIIAACIGLPILGVVLTCLTDNAWWLLLVLPIAAVLS